MSQPSAAATRQVILGYKCVHEGCQKSFESRKGYNVHNEIVASRAQTSSWGVKSPHESFYAALLMLNAQSFISSSLSTRDIKVLIAQICENRSCELLQILRKSANYICIISCILQQHLLAKVQRCASHLADFRLSPPTEGSANTEESPSLRLVLILRNSALHGWRKRDFKVCTYDSDNSTRIKCIMQVEVVLC